MIKRIFCALLVCIFSVGLSYGVSKKYDAELQQKNKQFLEDTENMDKREKRRATERQQLKYQKEILEKQEELLFMHKQKSTMDPNEKREQTKKLKEEIKSLHRAQKNLR